MLFTQSSYLLPLRSHYYSRLLHQLATSFPPIHHCQRRAFLLPTSPPLQVSASLTLPYARGPLFALIADIPSYPSFLPYLRAAHVTERSDAVPTEKLDEDPQTTVALPLDGRRWPRTADLHVAWKGYECVFRSQVECVPERIVEAVSAGEDGGGVFEELRTRWTLTDISAGTGCKTEVQLAIDARFKNALLGTLSQAAAPKVAGFVIEAFEKRAREILGGG